MNMLGGRATVVAPDGALPATAAGPVAWAPAVVALVAALAVWAALFSTEIAAAVTVWNTSTAYNHCWLIAPIATWLFWQRRERLALLAPIPAPVFALLAIPGTLIWFAAERLGIMEGRQLAAFGLAQVIVLTVLGWRFALAFAGPLAYLIFLVPFGGFAVLPLQHITAWMIDWGLDVLGITHYVDGLMIETPAGLFHVAEACAGLRFIIAALAFGALYALVIFRSPWRRLIVMALALAVPVLANGIRAGGIIVLAEYLGSAEAAAADHVIYGWGFFSAIILLLILAGLPFREDAAPPAAPLFPAPPGPPARPMALAGAAALAAGLGGAGPAAAMTLAYQGGAPVETTLRLAAPDGCAVVEGGLDCQGLRVRATMLVFSPRANWSEVSAARWRLGRGGSDTELTFTVPIGPAGTGGGGLWRARQADDGDGLSATASWLGGRAVGDGLGSRAAQARNSLAGGAGAPVLVVVRAVPTERAQPLGGARERQVFQAVLAAQGAGLAAEAAARSQGN
ncbi:exosortase A [Elioraea sp.]|uniref:exosortase A n=1 Tax=Elioraea sp. TaxID=2185103 RepID=UPI0025C42A23|nr:exosortase A [Elioraea sp.]